METTGDVSIFLLKYLRNQRVILKITSEICLILRIIFVDSEFSFPKIGVNENPKA